MNIAIFPSYILIMQDINKNKMEKDINKNNLEKDINKNNLEKDINKNTPDERYKDPNPLTESERLIMEREKAERERKEFERIDNIPDEEREEEFVSIDDFLDDEEREREEMDKCRDPGDEEREKEFDRINNILDDEEREKEFKVYERKRLIWEREKAERNRKEYERIDNIPDDEEREKEWEAYHHRLWLENRILIDQWEQAAGKNYCSWHQLDAALEKNRKAKAYIATGINVVGLWIYGDAMGCWPWGLYENSVLDELYPTISWGGIMTFVGWAALLFIWPLGFIHRGMFKKRRYTPPRPTPQGELDYFAALADMEIQKEWEMSERMKRWDAGEPYPTFENGGLDAMNPFAEELARKKEEYNAREEEKERKKGARAEAAILKEEEERQRKFKEWVAAQEESKKNN